MFEVEFFKKSDGTEPMREHLESLQLKLRSKVIRSLLLLQQQGNKLRYPETDSLGDGIYELRTIFGHDIERAFFFFTDGKKIIVTHGFVKKTQRTPAKEIEKAKIYRKEYLNYKKGK